MHLDLNPLACGGSGAAQHLAEDTWFNKQQQCNFLEREEGLRAGSPVRCLLSLEQSHFFSSSLAGTVSSSQSWPVSQDLLKKPAWGDGLLLNTIHPCLYPQLSALRRRSWCFSYRPRGRSVHCKTAEVSSV